VLVFAPAVLVLAGKGSWWIPAWADRVLPHMDVEGAGVKETAPPVPAIHPSGAP
jgi:putative drug exporter of the RND superfamily